MAPTVGLEPTDHGWLRFSGPVRYQLRCMSALVSALQSCPALALRGKSPSLAVVSPYGAPMPHITPVFPGCQILSVCRFSQRIVGAITTSTLEGLTSGLRIAHPAIPLKRCSLAVSTENWWFRQESNLRHIGSRSPPLFRLSYETMLRWAVRTHRATGKELKVKNGI